MSFNYEKAFSLEGQTVLITGASSGIGQACAVACSQAGARVLACGRNEARLQGTLAQLDKQHLNHRALLMELTHPEEVDAIMGGLQDEGVNINGFVHCAGVSTTLPLRNFKPEHMQQMFNTNVTAALYLAKWVTKKKFVPESEQSIVLMSSVMGNLGESGKCMYSATKGALQAVARSLAVELASKKIRVNTISPGVVETPMSQNAVYSRNEEARKAIEEMHPLGLGRPDDVAAGVLFLISPASRWVTGVNLVVDGGYSSK